MKYVIDGIEGLTHVKYDDGRTRCGLWFTMWHKELHDFMHASEAVPTCIVCAGWQPQPLDKPLWRPPEWG